MIQARRGSVAVVDHASHQPVDDCPDCQFLAVEPGWYRALRDEHVLHRRPDRIAIPDAGVPDVEILLPGSRVTLPDLEESSALGEPTW
jgi:hypothetical protein